MTTLVSARTPKARPPISINGTILRPGAIAREVQHHPAGTVAQSWRQAAVALVIRELLLQEAARREIVATPQHDDRNRRETEEEATIRALVEREVCVPIPTQDELRRYYEANRSRFRVSEIVEVRHILIAARADDAATYAAAREEAQAVAAVLAADPDAFAILAKAHSDCVSAGEGGYLGQLTPEETTPEFAAALAGLSDGETTLDPVPTRYGFHLIRLECRSPAMTLPFDTVAEQIARHLAERARHIAAKHYIARLISRADIVGIDIAGAEAHRVN